MAYDLNRFGHFEQLCQDVGSYLSYDNEFDCADYLINKCYEKYDICEVNAAQIPFGYVAVKENEKSTHDAAAKIVMNRMGFLNIEDYSNSYPGKYGHKTIHRDMFGVNAAVRVFTTFSVINPIYFTNTIKYNINRYNNVVTYPTIREITCCDCFDGIDPKYMWFCEDWNEVE